MGNSIFVGRIAHLEQLNTHWHDAYHKKNGKVIFLVGEAGKKTKNNLRALRASVVR